MNCKRLLLLYAAVLILSAAFYVPDSAEAKQQEHGHSHRLFNIGWKRVSRCENSRPYRRPFFIPCGRHKRRGCQSIGSRNKRPRHLLRTNEKKAEQKARAADQLLQKTCDSDRL